MVDDREDDAELALPGGSGWVVDGRYRIERLIGRGGVGAVYEATRLGTDERVAIKLVQGQYAQDDGVVLRFARAAKAASAVADPHIVRVLDSGSHEGRPFLVIELLLGEDLGARLRRSKRIGESETVHIVLQLLHGLVSAHAAGIVHRDLKPDNVLLVERAGDASFVKIVDFGTSKIQPLQGHTAPLALTHRGVVVGTPLYMSPEQAEAKSDVDERSDLYSVGAIAFECLTGRPPHVGESDAQVLASIRASEAPAITSLLPSLALPLATFIDKALARERTARFASARQMLEALAALAPNDPASVLPPAPPSVIRVTLPSDPGLAFADTLPHSSDPSPRIPLTPSGPAGGRGADTPGETRVSPGTPPTKTGESGGAPRSTARSSNPAFAGAVGEKRARTSRPSAPPKRGGFAWSWVGAFVAALGGVMTTAWVASSLRGSAPADEGAPVTRTNSALPVATSPPSRRAAPAAEGGAASRGAASRGAGGGESGGDSGRNNGEDAGPSESEASAPALVAGDSGDR
jgi:serine/threonine protein kinase